MGTFSQYQYPHTLERYAECAHFCGVCGKDDSETLELFIQKIEQLKERVGIKKTIRDYGVDEKYFLETLDQMVEDAFDGSLPAFVAAFTARKALSAEEVAALREMIDAYGKES